MLNKENQPIDPGLLIVMSGPSGTGKSTLCRQVVRRFERLEFSISYTTRGRRAGEADGRDYFFVDEETFDRMAARGAFAEWAVVHGNKYGTSLEFVRGRTATGASVILDIDPQGASQIKRTYPEAVFIFCVAPSANCLENRLKGRGTDDAGVVARRLGAALGEIRQAVWYDYIVVNGELEKAIEELTAIIVAEGCRRERIQARMKRLFEDYGIVDIDGSIG